jgi:hypothetical protein
MTQFKKEDRPVRSKMISVRMTEDQSQLLVDVAEELNLEGVADLIRHAVDCFLENDRKAAQACRKVLSRQRR